MNAIDLYYLHLHSMRRDAAARTWTKWTFIKQYARDIRDIFSDKGCQ